MNETKTVKSNTNEKIPRKKMKDFWSRLAMGDFKNKIQRKNEVVTRKSDNMYKKNVLSNELVSLKEKMIELGKSSSSIRKFFPEGFSDAQLFILNSQIKAVKEGKTDIQLSELLAEENLRKISSSSANYVITTLLNNGKMYFIPSEEVRENENLGKLEQLGLIQLNEKGKIFSKNEPLTFKETEICRKIIEDTSKKYPKLSITYKKEEEEKEKVSKKSWLEEMRIEYASRRDVAYSMVYGVKFGELPSTVTGILYGAQQSPEISEEAKEKIGQITGKIFEKVSENINFSETDKKMKSSENIMAESKYKKQIQPSNAIVRKKED